MEHYASDEEQVEAIKTWLKANGGAIVTGLIVGLAVIFGWQYWNSYQISKAEQASIRFDALSQAIANDDMDAAKQYGQDLLNDDPDSSYAAIAALMLAKLAAKEGNNDKAAEHIQWVLEHAEQAELKTIARLRLVRILIAEGRLDDAETQLTEINNTHFSAEQQELRGDIYLARNDLAQARNAYQAARAVLANSDSATLLDIKLDNLAIAGQE